MATMTEVDETLYLSEEARTPGRLRRFWSAHYHRLLGWAAVIVFIAAWEWLASSGRTYLLFTSSPSRILSTYVTLFTKNNFANDILVTAQEFALGFGIAILVAIPLGIMMGWYRIVEAIFDPFVNFLYATPRVALLPLIIIWLGIGMNSKILLVFFGAFFSILINTTSGIRNVDPELLRAARSFGASDFQIFRTIGLPSSVPFILTGVRLGLGHALIGVVVAELYASSAGVGHLIAVAGNTFQTDKVFAGVILMATTGIVITAVIRRIENHFQSWRPLHARGTVGGR